MVQLRICSGKQVGTESVARRFPFRLGRSTTADLRLEEDGVWDQHLEIDFRPLEGFVLRAQANALAAVNGQSVEQAVLHSGDIIQIGSLKIQFWLSETCQASLRFREWLTWAMLIAVTAEQVALIYRLLD